MSAPLLGIGNETIAGHKAAFDYFGQFLAHAREPAAPEFQPDPDGLGVDLTDIDIDPPVFPLDGPEIFAVIPDAVDRGSVRIREHQKIFDPIVQ